MVEPLGFVHRFEPASRDGAPTLLLLHGTGGNEDSLMALGRELVPGAALLSPRGKVLELGAPRFFRRLAEGVFDEADVIARANELADFVAEAAASCRFNRAHVFAVGYSNGANIAGALLLLRPEVLRGAVLLRAMVPTHPQTPPDLSGVSVLLSSGRADGMIGTDSPERLRAMLVAFGATVTHRWYPTGHELTREDVRDAAAWLAQATGGPR